MRKIQGAMMAAAVALAPFVTTQVTAQSAPGDMAVRFGAREYVQQMSMSPDGTKVAFVAPMKGPGSALMIADTVAGGDPKVAVTANGETQQLQDCHWATDSRLLCTIAMIESDGGDLVRFTRMIAVNADGSNIKVLMPRMTSRSLGYVQNGGNILDWGANGSGSVMMGQSFVPENTTGARTASTREGYGVDLIDINTMQHNTIEQPKRMGYEYISDGMGNVRVMGLRDSDASGYDKNNIQYMYRMQGSREWLPLVKDVQVGDRLTGFDPFAVDPKLNVVYGFSNEGGRQALYSISLDGKMTKTLVYGRPDVDVDDLIRVGRQRRVIGVSYATEHRTPVFFDPQYKSLQAGLGKALPGKQIGFVDASADESRVLVYISSDMDPGSYYIYDRKTHQLELVMPVRPALEKVTLSPQKAITYTAADGTQVPAYLTLPAGSSGKGLPAIVMPHGGPDARDEWGFDWFAQFFAARGYAVIQPNYRGSSGYGDAWFMKNGFQSWRTAIGDVNDAGRYLVKSGIADPRKLAIVGWSYGGYAALQSSVLDPDLFKAIVAVAPVTDLETLRNEHQHYTDFVQVDAQIGHGAWVSEASPARNVQQIKAPVLMFHGDRDQNVGIGESRLMQTKLQAAGKPVTLVEYKGLTHSLVDGEVRAQMLDKMDLFLRASMHM